MPEPTIFHNPSCSKSRGAKALLEEAGGGYRVVEYLKAPPTRDELAHLLDILEDPPANLVRTGDPKFKQLGLDASAYTEREAVLELLLEHPEVMERPVVAVGERAVIGRPPERIQALLD